jgi:high affinity sulfate transporter 1
MDESPASEKQSTATSRLKWQAIFPIASWLPKYEIKNLRPDIVAGITFATFVLPQSMAYATLAGLPVESGIYCSLAAGLLFAFFTTTRQVPVAPTSAISLMVGTTVGAMAMGDESKWLAIASLTALVVAVICIIAFVLRLNSLVSFISENILLGFKAGAALSIMSTQLPKLFGVKGGGDNFFERIGLLIQRIPDTQTTVLLFGLAALALLILGERFFPGRPVSIVVVVASIVLVSFTSLAASGMKLTGIVPGGLPHIGWPAVRFGDVDGVLALAFACFLVGYIETISAARTIALKNNYEISPRQELFSLGAANVAAAFSSGFPVAGGLSQTTVMDKSGAKTPLALIAASVTLAIILLFFTGSLANLPEVVLAVIVLHAVAGLIRVNELRRLFYLSRGEFWIAMISLAGVLALGILKGVMLAAIISLAYLIRRTASPAVAVLGRIGDTDRYSDVARHPDNKQIQGVVILRIEASLLYFNVDHVYDQIRKKIKEAPAPVKLVILDMAASPYVDVAGSNMLLRLSKELNEQGISFQIVEALSNVRELLRKQGMEDMIGHISRRTSVHDAVSNFFNQPA